MDKTPHSNSTNRKASFDDAPRPSSRHSKRATDTARDTKGRRISQSHTNIKNNTNTNLHIDLDKPSTTSKSNTLRTASRVPADKVSNRVAPSKSYTSRANSKPQTFHSATNNDLNRDNRSQDGSNISSVELQRKIDSSPHNKSKTHDKHSTQSNHNKDMSNKSQASNSISDIKIRNANDDISDINIHNADNNNEKIANKSILSKIMNFFQKKVTKIDVFILSAITIGITAVLLTVGGGFITVGVGIAIAIGAFIINKIFSYYNSKEPEVTELNEIKAKIEKIKQDHMQEDKKIATGYDLSPPIKYTTEEDDEKITDPRTLNKKQKVFSGIKTGSALLWGGAALVFGIVTTVMTGGIAPVAVAGGCAFVACCKGVADLLDYRDKKRKFFEDLENESANTGIADNTNINKKD